MNLGLIGKKYIDTILYTKSFELGETNNISSKRSRLGGMYNIYNIEGIDPIYYPIGEKYATIISEPRTRTSIVEDSNLNTVKSLDLGNLDLGLFGEGNEDWYHVMYIDDIDFQIEKNDEPMSLDFCTTDSRSKYIDYINQSEFVFDSRERKKLYSDILTETPIILHDENGCECIILGSVHFKSSVKPLKDIHVNGAGDIFAATFIKEYLENGLESATINSSKKTTKLLKGKIHEEKI